MQDPAVPQGCTHFKLRQLLRAVARHYDAEMAGAGLKSSQFSLLSQVKVHGPVGLSALAGYMGMDASTLTRTLRPLLDKGWARQAPGADGRQRVVTITPEGRAKHAEAMVCWKRAQRSLNDTLGTPQVVALHAVLDRSMQQVLAADAQAQAETGG